MIHDARTTGRWAACLALGIALTFGTPNTNAAAHSAADPPQLAALVSEALANNPEIAAARHDLDAALVAGSPGVQRWRALAEGIDPLIASDPFWPRLATHLDQAARAGADVTSLVEDAMARHGALPDELRSMAQGFTEQAGVVSVREMVDMLETTRAFEADDVMVLFGLAKDVRRMMKDHGE